MDLHELAHVDGAELKFVVPEGEERVVVEDLDLDLDRRTAEVRQVYYVDTPDLALLARGVVLRARREQSGDQDSAPARDARGGARQAPAPGAVLGAPAGLVSESGPGEIDWPSLRAFGPVDVVKVTTGVRRLGLQLVARLWRYPDESSLLELSTRVRPHDLQNQSIRFWTFLAELGFDVAGKQETKATRTLALLARMDGAGMSGSTR